MELSGLENFTQHFAPVSDAFAVIGGCACRQWLYEVDMRFRSTQDIDMVLLLEAKDERFFRLFWEYVESGEYEVCYRLDGTKKLFRFERFKDDLAYPRKLELMTGLPDVVLPQGLRVVHVSAGDPAFDLSAMLIDDEYYRLIGLGRRDTAHGLPSVRSDVLLLLKAKAHLNIRRDKAKRKMISDHDATKHRNDVFSLAYLLDGEFDLPIESAIRADLRAFLELYGESNDEWPAILAHLKQFGRPMLQPHDYLDTMARYYKIEENKGI